MKRKKILKAKKDFKRDLKSALKDVKNGRVYEMGNVEEWFKNLDKKQNEK